MPRDEELPNGPPLREWLQEQLDLGHIPPEEIRQFGNEELLARLRVLLRKKDIRVQTQLKVDDLSLDLLTHKVTRGEKEIDLTVKEYALLEYLMRNAGNIVTRTMISEHVWDINFDTFTNVIDVYINYLRNKIDSGFENKMIHTVRGKGYLLKK